MMYTENPFTPSFGEVPAHMAGRRQIVAELLRALESAGRRPELTSVFSGARGTGKTTLLSLVAHKAAALGWAVVEMTAMPGMLDDVEIGVQRYVDASGYEGGKTLAGVSIAPLGSLTFEQKPPALQNWRSRISSMLDKLDESGTGLLITVDEIDPSLPEMIELAAVYQHFVRENRKVALLMAGLPHNISALLNDKTVSFLRPAQMYRLGRIADFDVEDALVRTIEEQGRRADRDGVRFAVEHIEGFPYLLQLVGYYAWDATPSSDTVTARDFECGIERARQELEGRVLEATYRELSDGDVAFLKAMLEDEGDSAIADVVVRMGRSSSQVAQYRRRLVDAGVIGARRRGVVGFDLPYFRDFLEGRLEEDGR